ncbi:MAG: hypothetical protein ISR65_05575 [Bacteriovoracaceae bacterium]|nr:hypothetical protein [Bacteriovoracaceae bacterium]
MALSLKEVSKSSSNSGGLGGEEFDKKRILRPWEGVEKLGLQTRTIQAREAVINAQQIQSRNNELIDKLKDNLQETFHIKKNIDLSNHDLGEVNVADHSRTSPEKVAGLLRLLKSFFAS